MYNLHCFLSDITRGRFKSKFLCKKGLHNYQIKTKVETTPIEESYKTPFITITRYPKRFITFRECACCGKKIDFLEV